MIKEVYSFPVLAMLFWIRIVNLWWHFFDLLLLERTLENTIWKRQAGPDRGANSEPLRPIVSVGATIILLIQRGCCKGKIREETAEQWGGHACLACQQIAASVHHAVRSFNISIDMAKTDTPQTT
jgi:hypothetical protein